MLFGPPGDKRYHAPDRVLRSFPDPVNLAIAVQLFEGKPWEHVDELLAQSNGGQRNEFTDRYEMLAVAGAVFLIDMAKVLAGPKAQAYVRTLIDQKDPRLHRSLSYLMSTDEFDRNGVAKVLGDRILELCEETRPGLKAIYDETHRDWRFLSRSYCG
jgi:hypothetical protein